MNATQPPRDMPYEHFQPFSARREAWNCRTCTHSIGYGEHHLYCQRSERVHVFPCGRWERGAGCD